MKPNFSRFTLALLMVAASAFPSSAQDDVTAQQIIETLAPGAITKGITVAPPALSADDQELIDGLTDGTKRITVVERAKINDVVAAGSLPSIDLEIFFEFDSGSISDSALPDLEKLGSALTSSQLAGQKFLLAGHTDAKGSSDYNLSLADQRAASVRQYLIQQYGIAGDQLLATGYGEEQLKNSDNPEANENRRVQIIRLSQ